MSLRKWNDNGGYRRGAKGIDDDKGADFVTPFIDAKAQEKMYGRGWWTGGGGHAAGPDKGEYSGKKDTKKWSESADYDTK